MHPDLGRFLAGKYELVALAGQGGMAEVFRAITHGAAGFRRQVAIKRIIDELSDNHEFVEMFVEEARVISELQHPNIVQIHDFDQDDDGSYFLVMEWVEGLNLLDWSLAHRKSQQPAPWHLTTAMMIEVLKALGAAHERRTTEGERTPIYHRDVTPANVLLTVGGTVKLADFGLARAMDRARMTRPEVVKGKLSYLAPELTHGHDPTVQSDLFSVGVVLYEVLTGGKLFTADTPLELLQTIRDCRVRPLSELRPDAPTALHEAIHRALAPDPEDRFSSARSMVRTLANILRSTPESTSAEVLGKSVVEARRFLRESRGNAPAVDRGA